MDIIFVISFFIGSAVARSAEDRAHALLEKAGGTYVCRVDKPEWMRFHKMYWGQIAVHDAEFREYLHELIFSNFTRVLECNVGVVAGYVRIARIAESSGNQELAYRSYQMAMVFIYTLRSRQRIPIQQEFLWRISTDEVIKKIQMLRLRYHYSDLPNPIPVDSERIGIVSICAYPNDHSLILKDITPLNRKNYAQRHGYRDIVTRSHPLGQDSDVCIQHSKLALMHTLLQSGDFEWLMWMDCDSIIVNQDRKITDIIKQYALPDTNILITEELLGLSSANWLIKRSDWSLSFLKRAFDISNSEIPFFGDQDAIISLAIGIGSLNPRIRIVPQTEINTYDALNAFYMGSRSYESRDLLITFPQCRDVACNSLFATAHNASTDNAAGILAKPEQERTWLELRVFGPGHVVAKMYQDQLR